MKRILLTDGQQRKTLAAARTLGAKGVDVLVADETRSSLTRFSKYCSHGLVCPSPGKEPQKYYLWLREVLQRYNCDVLFPMDDSSLEVVMQHKHELEKICRLPVPGINEYRITTDKSLTTAAANEAGLDCPKTIALDELDKLQQAVSELDFPVIIKPRVSSGSRGIAVVKSNEDLMTQYLRIHQTYPFPIIQEYIPPGKRLSVCLLFDSSRQLKASFAQEQLRFFPIERGPSTVQESVWRPELIDKSVSLMQKLNWCGVAEVEFLLDARDGKEKFMEINPRFWASLYMSILAGVDFPWLLFKTAMGEEVEEVFAYSVGVRCRWLLPGDVFHFLANKSRFAMDPPFLGRTMPKLHDDIVSLDDPLPTLGFFMACMRYALDKDMWKTMFQR